MRRRRGPNPALGPLEKGPFYAVRIVAGSLGTFAGLRTDGAARVLGRDGAAIPGLFAVGNDMSSIMGGNYPSGGITLGPAMTFGYVAGRVLAGLPVDGLERDREAGGDGMRFYEIATLKTVIFGTGKAAPAVEAWVKAGKGRLLGAFASDIGALNEVYVLRGFESLDELWEERDRALRSDNPFGCMENLVDLTFDTYRPLDFLPPVEAGKFGPFYELRSYQMKLNGLMPTMGKWEGAVPGRSDYSPLTDRDVLDRRAAAADAALAVSEPGGAGEGAVAVVRGRGLAGEGRAGLADAGDDLDHRHAARLFAAAMRVEMGHRYSLAFLTVFDLGPVEAVRESETRNRSGFYGIVRGKAGLCGSFARRHPKVKKRCNHLGLHRFYLSGLFLCRGSNPLAPTISSIFFFDFPSRSRGCMSLGRAADNGWRLIPESSTMT